MMTKTKTSAHGRVKLMWALPAIALLLFAFAKPDYKAAETVINNNALMAKELEGQKTAKLVGVVRDEEGDPLPGTSVLVKGGTVGTVCDIDGKFNLDVPENVSIVLSFVGKKTIVDTFDGITSGNRNEEAYNRKYVMKDAVIEIYNPAFNGEQAPPPPAKEKSVNSAKEKQDNDIPAPTPTSKAGGEKEIFYIVEQMPKYPGGYEAMQEFITKMQQKIAQSKGVKGKAKVAFTVNNKGKATDIKVVEKDNDDAAKGAVMIVSAMPDWTPGKQREKSVPVKYLLPLEFK